MRWGRWKTGGVAVTSGRAPDYCSLSPCSPSGKDFSYPVAGRRGVSRGGARGGLDTRGGCQAPGSRALNSILTHLLQVPARAEEITIPADVTPEKVPTHIVDYSGISKCCLPAGVY